MLVLGTAVASPAVVGISEPVMMISSSGWSALTLTVSAVVDCPAPCCASAAAGNVAPSPLQVSRMAARVVAVRVSTGVFRAPDPARF